MMNIKRIKDPQKWIRAERDNIINVFAWLIKEDKKQNPDLYKIQKSDEKKS